MANFGFGQGPAAWGLQVFMAKQPQCSKIWCNQRAGLRLSISQSLWRSRWGGWDVFRRTKPWVHSPSIISVLLFCCRNLIPEPHCGGQVGSYIRAFMQIQSVNWFQHVTNKTLLVQMQPPPASWLYMHRVCCTFMAPAYPHTYSTTLDFDLLQAGRRWPKGPLLPTGLTW